MGDYDEIHAAARAASERVYDDVLRARDESLATCAAQLEHRTTELTAARVEAAASRGEIERLTGMLEVVSADRDRLAVALAASEDDLAAARKRIAELEATHAPGTLLGACPIPGKMTASSRDLVIDRWGTGVAVRLFAGERAGWAVAPGLGDAGRLLLSWKPPLTTPINETECVAALVNLPAGSKVAVWHEADVKFRKNRDVNALANMRARQAEFHAIVKKHRPDLVVMLIGSGWSFDPKGDSTDPGVYFNPAHCDELGVDLDGLDGPKDFMPTVTNVQAWARENNIGWTVTEYQLRLTPSWGADDRAQWLGTQTPQIIALDWPPAEICLFESSAYATSELTTPAELKAWGDLVGR